MLPKTTPWYVILVFFLAASLPQVFLITMYLPEFLNFSGGQNNPDQLFGYDARHLTELYAKLGQEGMALYQQMLAWDFAFLSLTFAWIFLLFRNYFGQTPFSFLLIIPVLVVGADVCENVLQLLLMGQFPDLSAPLAATASLATMTKLSLTPIALVLLLVILGLFIRDRVSKRPRVAD